MDVGVIANGCSATCDAVGPVLLRDEFSRVCARILKMPKNEEKQSRRGVSRDVGVRRWFLGSDVELNFPALLLDGPNVLRKD